MTIKEIAAKAGVSIATVSHVINHTRYVSPELVDKIEAIIEESGYSEKIKKKVRKISSGRSSQIVAVFPNIKSSRSTAICAISCNPTRPAKAISFTPPSPTTARKRRKASCKT